MMFLFLLVAALALAPAATVRAEDVSGNDFIYPDIRFDVNVIPDFGVESVEYSDYLPPSELDRDMQLDSVSENSANSVQSTLNIVISQPIISSNDIMPYADYTGTQYTISTDLLNYFRGLVAKLPFGYHYVLFRSSQYNYVFAFGDDLTFNGSRFVGSNVTVITYVAQTNAYSYSRQVQSSFSFNPSSYLCYSDLSDMYPALSDVGDMSSRQILYCFVILCLFYTMGSFMIRGGARFVRKKILK